MKKIIKVDGKTKLIKNKNKKIRLTGYYDEIKFEFLKLRIS